MNVAVSKKCAEVFSRVRKVFDALDCQMFGQHSGGLAHCPRSKEEAQRVLAMSAEICSCLHSLVFLSSRPVASEGSEPIAQIVARPIAYFFFCIDEVVYARFPELVPEELKKGGKYVPSCSLREAIVKREDLDGLGDLLKEASEKCRQALGDLLQTRMRRW